MTRTGWVDVVLVNYRSADAVVGAVRALQGTDGRWPHGAIHVVDNSEDPREALALGAAFEGRTDIRLQVMPRNVGFGAACNAAWAQSTARYGLLLNPDALIEPQAVVQLAKALDARTDVGAASPRTWWDAPGGWVLPCPTAQHPRARMARAVKSRRAPHAWADAQLESTRREMAGPAPVFVDMLAGAVLLVRREAVEQAGGLFDPSYFMYFEDADLSQRLRAAGWKLAVLPQVDAVHSWRHQAHKALLMDAGQAVFLQRQAAWYRALRGLWPGVETMGRLGAMPRWRRPRGTGLAGAADGMRLPMSTLVDAQEAARFLGPVSALSPAPSGDPAWVRWGAAQPLTVQDWHLLEPGHYWARTPRGWVGFEKQVARRQAGGCPCCGAEMRVGLESWHTVCGGCGYEGGRLLPQIQDGQARLDSSAAPALDEALRREALQSIRQSNFQRVLKLMKGHRPAGQVNLLDVGAAHGWFVQTSQEAEPAWKAAGLEPDAAVAATAQAEGLAVRQGYFPQALAEDERFDAITFHDVFEHLPEPHEMLKAVRRHLRPAGLLVLNLPSSEGVFFRVARQLARWGLRGPWHRMWQVGMPSPHLHYFDADNLELLLRRHGFEVVERSRLPSIVREGLMARLRFDPKSAWMAPLLGPPLWLFVPLLQRLSPDIRVLIARCQADASDRP